MLLQEEADLALAFAQGDPTEPRARVLRHLTSVRETGHQRWDLQRLPSTLPPAPQAIARGLDDPRVEAEASKWLNYARFLCRVSAAPSVFAVSLTWWLQSGPRETERLNKNLGYAIRLKEFFTET